MNNLSDLLSVQPYKMLRAIVTRLQIRKNKPDQKDVWIQNIHDLWHSATLLTFQQLSEQAQAAALFLAQAHSVPAILWFAEYGDARPAQAPRTKKEKPPWIEPRNVSEELIYSGLLFFENQNGHTNRDRVTLPHDLRGKLQVASNACGMSQVAEGDDVQPANMQPARLLHDLAHYLCYLQEQTELILMHGRWLSPTRLGELNQRLLNPESGPTHKQSHWQSLLAFLAEAIGGQVEGRLTAQGWAWLEQTPQVQLTRLWQAWQAAAPKTVQAYGQPGAGLSTPWPQLLVEQIIQIEPPFTPSQLAYQILGSYPTLNGYFLAHLGDISTLVMVVEETLDNLLALLGMLNQQAGWYEWTPLGQALLAGTLAEGTLSIGCPYCDQAPPRLTQTMSQLTLTIPAHSHLPEQARLTAYARHVGLVQTEDQQAAHWHKYQLTEKTTASAFSQGFGLQSLRDILAALNLTLAPEANALLDQWWLRAREIEIRLLPILQTANPQIMAQLYEQPAITALLTQQLSPTTAILGCRPEEAVATAQQAGYYPETPTPQPQSPPATQSVLWLAGQLYKLLGQHIPLPLPLSAAELQPLYDPLPDDEKALLQSHLDQAQQNLLAALDDLVFTPPPNPSDPEEWFPIIQQAIDDEANLTIHYFTAGRNLLTKRVVEPYWIETHRATPYLRAYCHQSGQVLTFRLDRISELSAAN